MTIAEFQKRIEDMYLERDRARGLPGTFMWFMEEVGELSEALLKGTKAEQEGEFADVFAWLSTLASLAGIDMETVVDKYREGCPRCKSTPCACDE